MPNLEDISYTSKADIMVVKRNLDLLNAGAVWDATHSGNNLTVTGAPEVPYTLRFVATGKYLPENGLKVNNTAYTAQMPNGKALPSGAWDTGAVVLLQVDPVNKKAFFSGGGADLSFITAGAEQILAGFIGANADGEPVEGKLHNYVNTGIVSTRQQSSTLYVSTTCIAPDFTPDFMVGYSVIAASNGNLFFEAYTVDYRSEIAYKYATNAAATLYSGSSFSSCPLVALVPGKAWTIERASGASHVDKASAKIVALKF